MTDPRVARHGDPALLTSTFVLAAGNGLLLTLIPVRAALDGRSTTFAALLAMVYFGGLVGGSLGSPVLIRTVGPIRTFAGLAAVLAATALLLEMSASPAVWLALRAAGGFCVAGLFVVVESWLNAQAATGHRGRLLAVYAVVLYLALACGQLLLWVAPAEGPRSFSAAAILLVCSLVPLALSKAREPSPERPEILGLGRLWSRAPLGLVACFVSGLLVGPLLGLAPIWAMQPAQASVGVSGIMAAAIVGGLALQLPVGWLSDHVDRRWVLAAVLVVLGVAAPALGLAGPLPPAALIAGAFLVGGLTFLVYPLGLALANDRLAPGQMVAAAGSLMLAYAVGAALAPPVVGRLMDLLGPGALFPAVGVIATAAGLATAVRARTHAPLPAGDQASFVPMPTTARSSALVTEALEESLASSGDEKPPSAEEPVARGA